MEVEQKYIVRAAQPWPLLQEEVLTLLGQMGCRVVRQGERLQNDLYYDGPGDPVLRGGCALRVRRTEDGFILSWKGPASTDQRGLFTRQELERPLPGPGLEGETSFLAECLSTVSGGPPEELRPKAAVENRRVTAAVSDPWGGLYELAFDRVVYRRPEGRDFREEHQIELEHKAGAGDGLTRIARLLEQSLPGLEPARGSKYQRARRLLG